MNNENPPYDADSGQREVVVNGKPLLIVASLLVVFALSACSDEPEAPAATGTGAVGTHSVDLVAGGGADREGSDAVSRLLVVPVNDSGTPLPIEFAVASDDAVWMAVVTPDEDGDAGSGGAGVADGLVRIDPVGAVQDVGFEFIDPAHIEGGSAGDRVGILSGPVSDGSGGVVVVLGPEKDSSVRSAPKWSRLYRVGSDGEVALVDLPSGYSPTGVGQSQSGGYVVQAVYADQRTCQRVFHVDGDPMQWQAVAGRDCPSAVFEPPSLAELAAQPVAPLDISLHYYAANGLRTGLLPDGRVVMLLAGVGLFVQGMDGVMHLEVADAPESADSADRTAEPTPSWSPLVADAPFKPFGTADSLRTGRAQFSLAPGGDVALLLDPADTPTMNSTAFHFAVADVPTGNNAQMNANELIVPKLPGIVPADSEAPATQGQVRGSGVAVFEPTSGSSADWPVSLVSGYGSLCQWRSEEKLVCGIAGYADEPAGTASGILVEVRVP